MPNHTHTAEYDAAMARLRELEREHFKQPCAPTRCSHLAALETCRPTYPPTSELSSDQRQEGGRQRLRERLPQVLSSPLRGRASRLRQQPSSHDAGVLPQPPNRLASRVLARGAAVVAAVRVLAVAVRSLAARLPHGRPNPRLLRSGVVFAVNRRRACIVTGGNPSGGCGRVHVDDSTASSVGVSTVSTRVIPPGGAS